MSGMKSLSIAAAAFLLALAAFAFSPAFGQGATSALQGHNTNAPVDFAADRIEVQDRVDRAILSGNVIVRQAGLQLNAARLTIAYSDARGIEVERINASGGVTVRSPSETARGQFAIYDLRNKVITLLGGVTLTRGDSNLEGGRLVLDLDSGRAVMDGSATGGGAPGAATPDAGGRVTGTFTVPQRND